jgi:hypothetical protein
MAQFNDTDIKGKLNIKDSLSQTDYKYNISSIENDEISNKNKMNISDDRIDTEIKGENIIIGSNTNTINIQSETINNNSKIIGNISLEPDKIVLSMPNDKIIGTFNPITSAASMKNIIFNNQDPVKGQIYFRIINT